MGRPIVVSNSNNLRVEIYLIGYAQQGESIIVFFRDLENNAVAYCIVVDSYAEGDCNKLAEILNNNGINKSKINILCWTHPDADHSVGLETIITDYCTKDTQVLIPYGLERKDLIINLDDYSGLVDLFFNLENQQNRHVRTISAGEKQVCAIEDFDISAIPLVIPVSIAALSPSNEYIAQKIHTEKGLHKNLLSIMLVLDIGGYRFLMTGDVENTMIERMREEAMINPTWVKIPHHSSTSSTKMIEVLSQNVLFQMLSGTTVKTQSGLPNPGVVNEYKSLSEYVHCTGIPEKEGDPCFGVVKYVFDLFGKHDVHITCEGNAYCV